MEIAQTTGGRQAANAPDVTVTGWQPAAVVAVKPITVETWVGLRQAAV